VQPRLKSSFEPGVKEARLARATVFQAVLADVPALLSLPELQST
jgi:hypothetical protein